MPSEGINPSIVSISRLDNKSAIYQNLMQRGIRFLSVLGLQDTPRCAPHVSKRAVNDTYRVTKATVLLGLDNNLNRVLQSTIFVDVDMDEWGSWKVKLKRNIKDGISLQMDYFSDPRIFVRQGRPMITFHSFRRFGSKNHLINELHVNVSSLERDVVHAKIIASETVIFCCGKNIAMLEESSSSDLRVDDVGADGTVLRGLEWIDPVTVVSLDKKSGNVPKDRVRRNIHGTNGFMVTLSSSSELLGIGHYHRNDPNQTGGTHYTHAFFTLLLVNQSYYQLSRLSNEIIIPSFHRPEQAETIQFMSGVELVGDDKSGRLLISYGINDCEGAIFDMKMERVQEMLQPVKAGQQVSDLIMNASISLQSPI
jgi:hypothetical protein